MLCDIVGKNTERSHCEAGKLFEQIEGFFFTVMRKMLKGYTNDWCK